MGRKEVKTKGHLKALLKVDEPRCGICGHIILPESEVTIDHIIPVSLGGTNFRDNVQLAHPRCNRKKGNNLNYKPKNPLRQKQILNSTVSYES